LSWAQEGDFEVKTQENFSTTFSVTKPKPPS
jgi:hypothetical protein